MRLCLILCLSLLTTTANAEPRQFGSILYDLPSGWIKGRERDGYVTLLSDLPGDRCEYCTIYLATGEPLPEDISDWLYRNIARFIDEDDHDDIEPIGAAEVTTLNGRPAALLPVEVNRYIYMLAAVQTGDQGVLLGFRGDGSDLEDTVESLETFASDVLPIWESLDFVNPGENGLLPPATPGDMTGILWGFTSGLEMQISGMAEFRVRHTTIVFYADGHFYHGTPPQGTATLDRAALLAAANTDFGVYTRRGRNLTLTYADGTTDDYRWDGGGWVQGRLSLRPVETRLDGTSLAGSISDFSYTSFAQGSGIDGGASRASSTTFYPDGTFEGESFGAVIATVPGGGITTGNSTQAGGTYHVQNGMVIMTPNDGSPPVQSLIFEAGEYIMIGDQVLRAN